MSRHIEIEIETDNRYTYSSLSPDYNDTLIIIILLIDIVEVMFVSQYFLKCDRSIVM
jgi:hypothetical protein